MWGQSGGAAVVGSSGGEEESEEMVESVTMVTISPSKDGATVATNVSTLRKEGIDLLVGLIYKDGKSKRVKGWMNQTVRTSFVQHH